MDTILIVLLILAALYAVAGIVCLIQYFRAMTEQRPFTRRDPLDRFAVVVGALFVFFLGPLIYFFSFF